MRKKILCLDFDGVLHSYTSGWKGAATIPDEPVPGALQFLVESLDHFEVHIFSSRSHQWGGKRAMKQWLRRHLEQAAHDWNGTPEWLQDRILYTCTMDPWEEEVRHAVNLIIKRINWPWFKPPAHLMIDDRAMQFDGNWPSIETIRSFKPWNKR